MLIFAILALVAWIEVLIHCSALKRARAVLILSLLANTIPFTLFGLFRWLPPATLNTWSALVRAHGMACLVVLGVEQCCGNGKDGGDA